MFLVVIIWASIVSSLTTVTVVRDNCINKNECRIVPEKIGVSIQK